jgi:hypothetical protein
MLRPGNAGPDTAGLRNLPLHGFSQNQIWCELAAMACELLAWMAMLALDVPCPLWPSGSVRRTGPTRPAGRNAPGIRSS